MRNKIIVIAGAVAGVFALLCLCLVIFGLLIGPDEAQPAEEPTAVATVEEATEPAEPTPEPTEEPTATPEPTDTPEPTVEPTETPEPSPTPEPIDTPAPPTPKPEPTDDETMLYQASLASLSDSYVGVVNELVDRFGEVGDNPTLIVNDEWRSDVWIQLILLEVVVEDFRSLDPPPAFQPVQDELILFADDQQAYIEEVHRLLDTYDVNAANLAVEHQKRAIGHMENATRLLEEMQ